MADRSRTDAFSTKLQPYLLTLVILSFQTPAFGADLIERQIKTAEMANVFSAIGVLLTFSNLCLLVWTLRLTNKAANAAANAANAAIRTIDHEVNISKIELRPYVLRTKTEAWKGPNGKWVFRIVWMNHGKTPARKAFASSWLGRFTAGMPADYGFPTDPNHFIEPAIIGPNGDTMNTVCTIGEKELGESIDLGEQLHLWGWIEYEGINGAGKYRTEYHVIARGQKNADETYQITSFSIAKGFNGVDEDCLRPPGTS